MEETSNASEKFKLHIAIKIISVLYLAFFGVLFFLAYDRGATSGTMGSIFGYMIIPSVLTLLIGIPTWRISKKSNKVTNQVTGICLMVMMVTSFQNLGKELKTSGALFPKNNNRMAYQNFEQSVQQFKQQTQHAFQNGQQDASAAANDITGFLKEFESISGQFQGEDRMAMQAISELLQGIGQQQMDYLEQISEFEKFEFFDYARWSDLSYLKQGKNLLRHTLSLNQKVQKTFSSINQLFLEKVQPLKVSTEFKQGLIKGFHEKWVNSSYIPILMASYQNDADFFQKMLELYELLENGQGKWSYDQGRQEMILEGDFKVEYESLIKKLEELERKSDEINQKLKKNFSEV